VAYIDIKSAFDSVDRVALWKALSGSDIPPFLLQLIRDLHTGTTAPVRTPQGMSDVFYTSGVRQGCILAPAFYCCAIVWLMRHCSGCFGVDVGNFHLTDINYADDAVLFTDDPNEMGLCFFKILRHQQALWVSTQTGIKRRSKILELKMLQNSPYWQSSSRDSNQVYLLGLWHRLRWLLLARDTQTPGHRWFHYGSTWQCLASAKT